MKKTMKKLASIALAGAFALSAVVAAPVAANAASPTDASPADASSTDGAGVSASGIVDKSSSPIDLDAGEYEAFIYLQAPKYTFRDSWDTPGSGGRDGSPLFEQMTFQADTANGSSVPATFNDTVIKGNGTYTVSATGIEWPDNEFEAQDHLNLMGVSFNMPVCDKITISDVVLKIDGNEISQSAKTLLEEDAKDGNCYNLLVQNIWNEDEGIKNIGYYKVPFSDVSITFTVSGFNYDNPDATGEAPVDDSSVSEDTTGDDSTDSTDTTEASASEKKDDKDDESSFPVVPVVIGVVVVIAAVAVVVIKKKK